MFSAEVPQHCPREVFYLLSGTLVLKRRPIPARFRHIHQRNRALFFHYSEVNKPALRVLWRLGDLKANFVMFQGLSFCTGFRVQFWLLRALLVYQSCAQKQDCPNLL